MTNKRQRIECDFCPLNPANIGNLLQDEDLGLPDEVDCQLEKAIGETNLKIVLDLSNEIVNVFGSDKPNCEPYKKAARKRASMGSI